MYADELDVPARAVAVVETVVGVVVVVTEWEEEDEEEKQEEGRELSNGDFCREGVNGFGVEMINCCNFCCFCGCKYCS